MDRVSLRSRAAVVALGAGALAFALAWALRSAPVGDPGFATPLAAAIASATTCWLALSRATGTVDRAIAAAIARLMRAALGDFDTAVPHATNRDLPALARAMRELFGEIGANFDKVHQLASFDAVTGLPNRTHFRLNCEQALAQVAADSGGALFFIDLDHFKGVNDTQGHAVGDQLLRMVADRLRATIARFERELGITQPLIGRLAGDEFTIFLPGIDDSEGAARIGRGILFALAEPFHLAGQEIVIGASVGIAQRPQHGLALSDLMRAADLAMYHAKGRGGGRAEHFTDTLAIALAERSRLEHDLRTALAENQFLLFFQPQVAAGDGVVVAVEALLRWRHPDDGLLLPGYFLQQAEESGLIVEIGDWVVGTVAETLARWARLGIRQRLAINVSRREIDRNGFFRDLRRAMHAAGAPARLLELEITESLAMHCSREVIDALAALRADGATIAIDDFGTGYSNLARLRDLPIDRIKLDRSIIEHVADRSDARTIAHAVISLIHGLGCEAVAEGIESDAQANVLRIVGCDVLQGYAVAPPMDEAALIAWTRDQDRRLVG